MAILAGNLSSKISFALQYRIFSIPWVNRNNKRAILCLKGRDYSSSMPVRYIPKKSDDSPVFEQNELTNIRTTTLSGSALRIDLHDKHQNRNPMPINNLSLFNDAKQEIDQEELDHELGVIDNELMEEPEEVVEEIRISRQKDIRKAMLDVEKVAVELLATRAFTTTELRKKLLAKRFPPEVVNALINDFQSRGLINDGLYAESFSRSRWSSSSWGPRRIKQALSKKGVSEADAEKALKLVFEEGESGEDQELKLGMSKLSMDHLFVQASKQWLRGRDVPKETRKTRIIRWLQYRGFNWGVISFVLKKLESQNPT